MADIIVCDWCERRIKGRQFSLMIMEAGSSDKPRHFDICEECLKQNMGIFEEHDYERPYNDENNDDFD